MSQSSDESFAMKVFVSVLAIVAVGAMITVYVLLMDSVPNPVTIQQLEATTMRSRNGQCWKVVEDNEGMFAFIPTDCP